MWRGREYRDSFKSRRSNFFIEGRKIELVGAGRPRGIEKLICFQVLESLNRIVNQFCICRGTKSRRGKCCGIIREEVAT